jgi:acetolactate synthase I/II/III large subunit
MKYSDLLADWLLELNYTHCFFVGGGNIMHLTESLSRKLKCIPVIHEVAAGIAAEYFNKSSQNKSKALALVTAGPGITNIITAIAGAFLESRELLVIGGQVKTSDLSNAKLRQRGIQEIDGVSIIKPISVNSSILTNTINQNKFNKIITTNHHARKGPIFLEIPIDIQAKNVDFKINSTTYLPKSSRKISDHDLNYIISKLNNSKRPSLLIGGGVSRVVVKEIESFLKSLRIPIFTTWNGADRITTDYKNYMGRPNTWGQRSSNIILQQSDLLVAVGSRLGMQQTGFNWKSFLPGGEIIQIDIDKSELKKGHPHIKKAIWGDANFFLKELVNKKLFSHDKWLMYAKSIRRMLPLVEPVNKTRKEYISPYVFIEKLSKKTKMGDIIIPCSSGSAFTVMMQVFELKKNQSMITNKGLASMGYGLSGAIGASIANKEKRTILVEGDGGFAQNIQELGTVAINNLNLKMFIFDDSGHASIRATQKNYFNGSYVGCDTSTGLGLPDWQKLFNVWNVPSLVINGDFEDYSNFDRLFNSKRPAGFIVKIDPEQTYFPKISSRVTKSGSMESNPLHLMTPDLEPSISQKVSKYLKL